MWSKYIQITECKNRFSPWFKTVNGSAFEQFSCILFIIQCWYFTLSCCNDKQANYQKKPQISNLLISIPKHKEELIPRVVNIMKSNKDCISRWETRTTSTNLICNFICSPPKNSSFNSRINSKPAVCPITLVPPFSQACWNFHTWLP